MTQALRGARVVLGAVQVIRLLAGSAVQAILRRPVHRKVITAAALAVLRLTMVAAVVAELVL